MAIRKDRRNIPTTAVAVVEFMEKKRSAGLGIKDHKTVLLGPSGPVRGRQASGPALARSHLGSTACYRLTSAALVDWFNDRHPEGMSQAARKRGMSSMRQFIEFCLQQGYIDDAVAAAVSPVKGVREGREWLHPEQVVALTSLVEDESLFDAFDRFAWFAMAVLGARPFEVVLIKPRSLDPRTKEVTVIGKGPGEGKMREVPVDDEFIARWHTHRQRFGIGPDGWMLFAHEMRFGTGGTENVRTPLFGRHASERAMRLFLERVQKAADERLDPALAPSFKLTPKVLRRTFACTQVILHELGLGGLDLVSLKDALGHSSLDTTRVYLSDVGSYLNRHRRPVGTLHAAEMILASVSERDGAI
jgi:integrase